MSPAVVIWKGTQIPPVQLNVFYEDTDEKNDEEEVTECDTDDIGDYVFEEGEEDYKPPPPPPHSRSSKSRKRKRRQESTDQSESDKEDVRRKVSRQPSPTPSVVPPPTHDSDPEEANQPNETSLSTIQEGPSMRAPVRLTFNKAPIKIIHTHVLPFKKKNIN